MNLDDPLFTNKFISSGIGSQNVQKGSNIQARYTKHSKKKKQKKMFMKKGKKTNSQSILGFLGGTSESPPKDSMMTEQKKIIEETTSYQKLKKTIVTIDSRNRDKIKVINLEPLSTVPKNALQITENSRTIIIHHPDHNIRTGEKPQIIIRNVKGDLIPNSFNNYKNTLLGIPIRLINYDDDDGGPVHIIQKIIYTDVNGNILINQKNPIKNPITGFFYSDYYEIIVDKSFYTNSILEGFGGGGDIIISKLLTYNDGYPKPSHYKITLGRKFKNVLSVRLISTEIPNTPFTIEGQSYDKRVFGNYNKNELSAVSDKLYWISKEDNRDIYNYYTLHTKSVLAHLSLDNLENTNFIPSNKQKIWQSIMKNEIDNNSTLTLEYQLAINSSNSTNNWYLPASFFLSANNWPPNWFLVFGKTLIQFIEDKISEGYSREFIQESIPEQYEYYIKNFNKYRIYGGNIPMYIGYWLIYNETITTDSEFKDTNEETYPPLKSYINVPEDGVEMAPILLTSKYLETNFGQKGILHKKYPIYKVRLDEGKYNINTFVEECTTKMNNTWKKTYDWSSKEWIDRSRFSRYTKGYLGYEPHDCRLNLDGVSDIISFTNNNVIYSHAENKLSFSEEGPFLVYEHLPILYVKDKGHELKQGDIITVEESTDLFGVDSDEINKQHIVNVGKVFKMSLRIISPLPDKAFFNLLYNNFNNNTVSGTSPNPENKNYICNNDFLDIIELLFKSGLTPPGIDKNLFIRANSELSEDEKKNPNNVLSMIYYMGSKLRRNPNDTSNQTGLPNDEGKNIELIECPFKNNELVVRLKDMYDATKELVIGKVNIIENNGYANVHGNQILHVELLTHENNGIFSIGDVIVGTETQSVAMIIPQYWNDTCLPKKKTIEKGIYNFMKNPLNNIGITPYYTSSYLGGKGSSNRSAPSDVRDLDLLNDVRWEIEEIPNAHEGYFFYINTLPNSSSLKGAGSMAIRIFKNNFFSMLFGYPDTPSDILGFATKLQGSSTVPLELTYSSTNTQKINEAFISQSYFLPIFNKGKENFLFIETKEEHHFSKGDRIYIQDHIMGGENQRLSNIKNVSISSIEPFSSWINTFPIENNSSDNFIEKYESISNMPEYTRVITRRSHFLPNSTIIYIRDSNNYNGSYRIFQATLKSFIINKTFETEIATIDKWYAITQKLIKEWLYFNLDICIGGNYLDRKYIEENIKCEDTLFINNENNIIGSFDNFLNNDYNDMYEETPVKGTYRRNNNRINAAEKLYSNYFMNKIIIHYEPDLTNKEIDFLSNQQKDISDFTGMHPSKSGERVYIHEHYQKKNKYYSSTDGENLEYLNQMGYIKESNKTFISNKEYSTEYTGIEDGSYSCIASLVEAHPISKLVDNYSLYQHKFTISSIQENSTTNKIDITIQNFSNFTLQKNFYILLKDTSIDAGGGQIKNYDGIHYISNIIKDNTTPDNSIISININYISGIINLINGVIGSLYYITTTNEEFSSLFIGSLIQPYKLSLSSTNTNVRTFSYGGGYVTAINDNNTIILDNPLIIGPDNDYGTSFKYTNPKSNKIINSLCIDKNWSDTIDKGIYNRGKLRLKELSVDICGHNGLKYNLDDSEIYNYDINTTLTTTALKGSSTFNVEDSTGLISGGLIWFNVILSSGIVEQTSQLNLIEASIIDTVNGNTITLKHPLKKNHSLGEKIIQRYMTINPLTTIQKNSTTILLSDVSNFNIGDTIIIDWHGKQNDIYTEEWFKLTSVDTANNIIGLNRKTFHTHSTSVYITLLKNITDFGNYEQEQIYSSCLSTQPILIDNVWHTMIFYQGYDTIDPFKYFQGGKECFGNFSPKTVFIKNMKSIQIPVTNFTESNDENIDIMTHIPDDYYDTIPYVKHDRGFHDETLTPLSIAGFFSKEYTSIYKSKNKWNNNYRKGNGYIKYLSTNLKKFIGCSGKITHIAYYNNDLIITTNEDLTNLLPSNKETRIKIVHVLKSDQYNGYWTAEKIDNYSFKLKDFNNKFGTVYTGILSITINGNYSDTNYALCECPNHNLETGVELLFDYDGVLSHFITVIDSNNFYIQESFNSGGYCSASVVICSGQWTSTFFVKEAIHTWPQNKKSNNIPGDSSGALWKNGIVTGDYICINTGSTIIKREILTIDNNYTLTVKEDITGINSDTIFEYWLERPDNFTYPYIIIKGKFFGYGGNITEKWDAKDHPLHNPYGYEVIDTLEDQHKVKNTIVLKITDQQCNVEHPTLRYQNIEFPGTYASLSYLSAFKQVFKVGSGGIIFQKITDQPVNLKGENFMYLTCPTLDTVITTHNNPIQNAFAKILLTSSVGDYIYNTFVSSPKLFYDAPFPELHSLEFKYVSNNNRLFDFHGNEHSISLEITELETKLENISSRSGTIDF